MAESTADKPVIVLLAPTASDDRVPASSTSPVVAATSAVESIPVVAAVQDNVVSECTATGTATPSLTKVRILHCFEANYDLTRFGIHIMLAKLLKP